MAVNEREKREAVTYIAAGDIPPPDDVDAAFDEWRDSLESGEEPGKIRAYQIPLDERGNPIATAKNQIRLGTWPIDLYGFDELCTMLIRDFMPAEKVLAVRLLGTKAGRAGLQFNKVVVLRAPKFNSADANGAAPPGESLAGLMKTIQDANERTLALVQSMRPPAQPDNSVERLIAMSQAMNQPMVAMLSAIVPALAGRGGGGDGGLGNLGAVVDLATKIADLRGGGGDESTGNDIVDAIKAIVPIAKPALEAIPSILAQRQTMGQPVAGVPALTGPPQGTPRPQPAGAVPPRPVAPPPPPPGSVPTQAPAPLVGVKPAPQMTDIPSGDQEMLAQLMPQIDALVAMAERGSPADAAADLIFDQYIMDLPETPNDVLFEKVASLLTGPNLINQAAVFNPKVLAHEQWFRQFQQRIVARYDQEEKEADGQNPTAANTG